jgi:hypothetical protein
MVSTHIARCWLDASTLWGFYKTTRLRPTDSSSHLRRSRLCITICYAELAKLDLVEIDTAAVESNIVLWHLKPEAPPVALMLTRLKDAGFIVGGMKGEGLAADGTAAG